MNLRHYCFGSGDLRENTIHKFDYAITICDTYIIILYQTDNTF